MAYDRGSFVSASNPPPVQGIGGAGLSVAQVSVAATATPLVAARAGRSEVTLISHGTADVFVGGSNVTATAGALLAGTTKGTSITLKTSAAVYGIVASGTQTISVIETY